MDMEFPRGSGAQVEKSWKIPGYRGSTTKPPGMENPGDEGVKLQKKTNCAVPENIHTPPTEGIGISWRGGGLCKAKKFKEMYEA